MNKRQVCIPIKDEKELQMAKEILLNNGEELHENFFKLTHDRKHLVFSDISEKWGVGFPLNSIEIKLSELENILKSESVLTDDEINESLKRAEEKYCKLKKGKDKQEILEKVFNMHDTQLAPSTTMKSELVLLTSDEFEKLYKHINRDLSVVYEHDYNTIIIGGTIFRKCEN